MYHQRTLENFFVDASQQFPIILVTGPRQVGKTTFLRHLSEGAKRTYVTLDDPNLAALAKEEPKLFLERFKPPVLIDEIQYAPELLPFIKMHVDESHRKGEFWLTGSQQFQLMKGVAESLAGRVAVINLLGLSLAEQQNYAAEALPFLPLPDLLQIRSKSSHRLNLLELYQKIWLGSFPSVALNPQMDRNLFYSSYVQTYIQRDIRDLAKVGDEIAFLKFLRAAAARTGQLLNLTELTRDCGISVPTAKHWLSILQASGIVYLLEPYFTNVTKRLIKTPKLYFLDTGLCCYLTEWSSPETLEAGAMSGAILETFMLIEIIKSFWHNGRQAPLYYYRDKDKKEIDVLIFQDQTIYPLEIKKTANIQKTLVKHFSLLKNLNLTIGPGGLICLADSLLPIIPGVNAIPAFMV